MSLNRSVAAGVLIGIVVVPIVLSNVFSGAAVAGYVVPLTVVLCVGTTWLLARAALKSEASLIDDNGVDRKRREMSALFKGLLSLLWGVGWAVVVAAAVRGAIVPSKVNVILWSLAPTFVLVVAGMIYLVRGFGSSFEEDAR